MDALDITTVRMFGVQLQTHFYGRNVRFVVVIILYFNEIILQRRILQNRTVLSSILNYEEMKTGQNGQACREIIMKQ